jgi:hypothetical protein
MKKKRFSVEQVIGVLKQAQMGIPGPAAAELRISLHTSRAALPASIAASAVSKSSLKLRCMI